MSRTVSAVLREPEGEGKAACGGALEEKTFGPSTNGRSSAFGALCLGSNPSGPAKFRLLSNLDVGTESGSFDFAQDFV